MDFFSKTPQNDSYFTGTSLKLPQMLTKPDYEMILLINSIYLIEKLRFHHLFYINFTILTKTRKQNDLKIA